MRTRRSGAGAHASIQLRHQSIAGFELSGGAGLLKKKGKAKEAFQSPWTPAPLNVVAAESSQSLRDVAYEAIKHRIITCVFKPGEYINEAYVSGAIGIGRTPVHQAIDRLMQDGLLEVIPRK